MNDQDLPGAYGGVLSKVAADALRWGLVHDAPLPLDPERFAAPLRTPRATFVTLERDGALRGCIGSLVPRRALVEDVAGNAYDAGFRDPRFPCLDRDALDGLTVAISILGPFETLTCETEEELFHQARVGVDGFVLSAEGRRGLFLPQVWDMLRSPRLFFETLRQKAGLPAHYWGPQLHIERFQVTSIPRRAVTELIDAGASP